MSAKSVEVYALFPVVDFTNERQLSFTWDVVQTMCISSHFDAVFTIFVVVGFVGTPTFVTSTKVGFEPVEMSFLFDVMETNNSFAHLLYPEKIFS